MHPICQFAFCIICHTKLTIAKLFKTCYNGRDLFLLFGTVTMKKSLVASLIASIALLTACGGDHADTVKAEDMIKTAEQNAKALAPVAEKVTFGDEGGPKAGETTANTNETVADSDTLVTAQHDAANSDGKSADTTSDTTTADAPTADTAETPKAEAAEAKATDEQPAEDKKPAQSADEAPSDAPKAEAQPADKK